MDNRRKAPCGRALNAVLTGLLVLAGCAKPEAPQEKAPALTASQATGLTRRWLATFSQEASVTPENFVSDPANGSARSRLTVKGIRFRDTLTHLQVEYSGVAEADFKLFAQGSWAMTSMTIDPGGKSAHTWDGLHITENYKADSPAALQRDDMPRNEESAIGSVRTLLAAEALFATARGNQCGSIRDLVQANLLDKQYAAETIAGYRFSITVSERICGVLATPKVLGLTGQRSFYAPLTDNEIRYTADRSIPTAASPKL